jgi:hypothetical protein
VREGVVMVEGRGFGRKEGHRQKANMKMIAKTFGIGHC